MLNQFEKELYGFFKENMESEALITYKKEAGMDGKTILQVNGTGAMLFDAVCIILKELAMAEAGQAGVAEMATEYIKVACNAVLSEVEREG